MLRCGLLLAVFATVSSVTQEFTIGDKWVPIIPKNRYVGQLKWVLTAQTGSGIRLFCPDFRFPMGGNYEESCGHANLEVDDGTSKQRFCENPKDFHVVGKSSRMIITFTSERVGGFLDCVAKASHPPKSYEDVTLSSGTGIKRLAYPDVRGEDRDKAWRFRSSSGTKLSIQCSNGMERRFNSGVCVKDIVTVDIGNGRPEQFCGGHEIANISTGSEITLRFETYPGTEAHIDCLIQSITGPNLNEHMNVKYPEEDSSEYGVAPGRKATTCECGRANKDNGRIINGKETTESKYPFMVSMRGTNGRGHFCGASILSPVHILTAAHCVSDRWQKDEPVPADLKPVVGAHSYAVASHGETQELRVKKVSVPKEWFATKGSLAGDIALLHLETPIRFSKWVAPVCLTPRQPPIINRYIKAMGWGLTEEGYPDRLREANVQVLDTGLCNNDIKETCFRNGNSSTCFASTVASHTGGHKRLPIVPNLFAYMYQQGDSGGPYVHVDPDTNRYTQVALVSYGYGKQCDGTYFIGTNVVHWYDWIKNNMAETSKQHTICQKIEQ